MTDEHNAGPDELADEWASAMAEQEATAEVAPAELDTLSEDEVPEDERTPDLEAILDDLASYRPKRRGWTWRQRVDEIRDHLIQGRRIQVHRQRQLAHVGFRAVGDRRQ